MNCLLTLSAEEEYSGPICLAFYAHFQFLPTALHLVLLPYQPPLDLRSEGGKFFIIDALLWMPNCVTLRGENKGLGLTFKKSIFSRNRSGRDKGINGKDFSLGPSIPPPPPPQTSNAIGYNLFKLATVLFIKKLRSSSPPPSVP